MKPVRWRLLAPAVILTAAAACAAWSAWRGPSVSVDFFAVGQGDSELVSCGRRQMLIDGGPDLTVLSELGRVLPFTDRDLEYVVLTHPHADHLTGLIGVLRRYRVGRVLVPAGLRGAPSAAAFLRAVAENGAELTEMKAGDTAILCPDAELRALWPDPGRPTDWSVSDQANDGSLVLRLSAFCATPGAGGCRTVLFMGDAGAKTEQALRSAGAPLAADILKVGHHGSGGASSAEFLAGVSPRQAVIEVGRNSFGHPAPAVLRRLTSRGIGVIRTDAGGSRRLVLRPGPAGGLDKDGPRPYTGRK